MLHPRSRTLALALILALAAIGCSEGDGPPPVTNPVAPAVDISGSYPLVGSFMVGDGAIPGFLHNAARCPDGSQTGVLNARAGRAEIRDGRITLTHETELRCGDVVTSVTTHPAEVALVTLGAGGALEFAPEPPATATRMVRGTFSPASGTRQVNVHFRGRHDEANEMVYGLSFRW